MFFHLLLFAILSRAFWVSASPVKVESRGDTPVLELPYGSFEATSNSNNIWTFRNIPYAAPPLGDLRWAKPAAPTKKSGVQPGNRPGSACLQAGIYGLNFVGSDSDDPIGKLINQLAGSVEALSDSSSDSEDCLYLDIQVPEKAIKDPSLKLPVVVYIFGGGYVLGDKQTLQPLLPLYDGTGMMSQSSNNFIYVSFNYRLGAMGFLAGTTMERDGLPNAGLWDQRAVFQWVQSYISRVGGDPGNVVAMGESAGASSLLFHLVAEGGKLDPLFDRAILLSPAYEPMWDRAGMMEDNFNTFASLAGCAGQGLACLRAASTEDLASANSALMEQQTPGSFAVGPTPDGSFIRQLPTVELALGNVWPIESAILSHVAHESIVFVNGAVSTNADFDAFLGAIMPNYTFADGIAGRVETQYPAVGANGSPFATQSDRVEAFLRDSSMTCNVRYLADALGQDKVWAMQYSVAPGWHGTDLLAAFWNEDIDMGSVMDFLASAAHIAAGLFLGGLARAYQSYFASYIQTGSPNAKRLSTWSNLPWPGTAEWSQPDFSGDKVANVLNVDYGLLSFFSNVDDDQMPQASCAFWQDFTKAVTVAGGYVPDGVVLGQDWVPAKGASANYAGGNS